MTNKSSSSELEKRLKILDDELMLQKLEIQALRLSNEKYKDLFENANDAIFIVDANLNYTEVNNRAVELFGFSKEEFLNMKITDVIPPSQFAESNKEFKKLRKQGVYEKFVGKQRTKDGRWLDIEVSSSAIVKNGKYIGSRDIVRDITERKKAEEELNKYRSHLEELVEERSAEILRYARMLEHEIADRQLAEKEREKLQHQLQQKQKIEAIGALSGGIAHDFNNILNAILSYTELSMHSLSKHDRIFSHLEKVVQSVNRARDLVRQILTFSSRHADSDRSLMALQPLAKEEIKILRGTLPENISIALNISAECRPIKANFIQIHQVIMNVGTNAIKAMSQEGGTLTVSLREEEVLDDQQDQYPDLIPQTYACLAFKDTGKGMERQTLEHIFEPYYTTDILGTGTGLGLATVHSIVKSHGGNCIVKSSPGQGTTFSVYLPIADQKINRAAHTKIKQENLAEQTGTILFVDDEKIIADVARIALEEYGHTVESYTNSCKALKAFKKNPQGYDVVVTDYKMPGLDGNKLAKKILELNPDVPVVMATGYSEIMNEKNAKEIGIKEFVMKPISMADLAYIISRLIKRQQVA